ncbi:3-oxoacyl-[acyl-carrier-protein] synthase [Tulasnella sp. 424]|nr:3-oxoacyl-[acyl-carrier-protein] synthase [Tulasnella sp. 424]
MSAQTTLEMAAAIRGIVASNSAPTDNAGRSAPTLSRGMLTIGRETVSALPTLDLNHRVRQLTFRYKRISQWMKNERDLLKEEVEPRRAVTTEEEAARQEKVALATLGMLEGADPHTAPLVCAPAIWGLTADDALSRSTALAQKANDKNELSVNDDIFKNLSRILGNAFPVTAQKNLTAHPNSKGGAAARMLYLDGVGLLAPSSSVRAAINKPVPSLKSKSSALSKLSVNSPPSSDQSVTHLRSRRAMSSADVRQSKNATNPIKHLKKMEKYAGHEAEKMFSLFGPPQPREIATTEGPAISPATLTRAISLAPQSSYLVPPRSGYIRRILAC